MFLRLFCSWQVLVEELSVFVQDCNGAVLWLVPRQAGWAGGESRLFAALSVHSGPCGVS